MSANADGLREILRRRCDAAFETALDTSSTEMQVAAPYLTGETVEKMEVELGDTGPHYSGTIRFPTPQALWTDEGTPAHQIVGNPFLAFEIGGRTIIVRSVNHPGTPRTGWFSDKIGPTYLAALRRGFANS